MLAIKWGAQSALQITIYIRKSHYPRSICFPSQLLQKGYPCVNFSSLQDCDKVRFHAHKVRDRCFGNVTNLFTLRGVQPYCNVRGSYRMYVFTRKSYSLIQIIYVYWFWNFLQQTMLRNGYGIAHLCVSLKHYAQGSLQAHKVRDRCFRNVANLLRRATFFRSSI